MTRTVVYFVGAGLSKALERSPIRVPVMQDFVNVAADYVEDDDVILTTLAVFAQNGWFQNPVSPRLKEIAPGLADGRGRNPALRSEFAGAMRSWPPENLEIMLKTARDRNPGVEERFSWAINRVFCHIGWQIEWAPLEDFVKRLAGIADTHHCFVSFNYDLLLGRVLSLRTDWKAANGYGVPIGWWASAEEGEALDRQMSRPAGAFKPVDVQPLETARARNTGWTLLKPHGSLNWLLTDAKESHAHRDEFVLILENEAISYFKPYECKALRFPDSGIPINADLPLLPPLSNKHELQRRLHRTQVELEQRALHDAAEVYVIGWSVPDTDRQQCELVRETMLRRANVLEKLTVVTFGAKEEYFRKVAELFSTSENAIERHNRGFVEFVMGGDNCCRQVSNWFRRLAN